MEAEVKIEINMSEPKINKTLVSFKTIIMYSLIQCQVWHWATLSRGAHIVLGDYIEDMHELQDSFVEQFIGRYGNDESDLSFDIDGIINDNVKLENHLVVTREAIEQEVYNADEIKKSSNLKNTLDEIIGLIDKTLYLLRFEKV